jgi:hypothetical protein
MTEKRNFDTEFPYIIDTETGPEDGTINLTKMSEEALLNLVPQLPEAMMELVYREIISETGT